MRLLPGAAAAMVVLPPTTALRSWQPIWQLQKQIRDEEPLASRANSPPPLYPAYNLTVPVDHFQNDSLYTPHVEDTFQLRYWFDASYYRPGGPVILLAAGETSGTDRLPFLQKGIAAQLVQATHGLGVVLEHRYYGTSFPYDNLTTESLRFLRMEQALADTVYFAQNVRFPGLGAGVGNNGAGDDEAYGERHGDDDNAVSPGRGAPWIVYGGSYAGAFAAFLRILYPDVFWGAISSSGVTVAIHDYWQYFEAQRLYAPAKCVHRTQHLIHAADQILLAARQEKQQFAAAKADQQTLATKGTVSYGEATARVAQLKSVFGLGNLTYDDDFAAVLSDGMAGWQETNWDPAENSPHFAWFCGNVTAEKQLYPELESRRAKVRTLLKTTSYADDVNKMVIPMLNFIGWVQATHSCKMGLTQDQCFSNRNKTFYQQDNIRQGWRSWTYQYCTQWGYLSTGSGVPADQLPLVSRLLDMEYLSVPCRDAFNISAAPDVESVNKYGSYDIHYARLGIIDGEADPWRAATPHALSAGNDNRPNTETEPFLLIGGGAVHHWDEYGLLPNETTAELPPRDVQRVQAEEMAFVEAWVSEWAEEKATEPR